MNKTTHAHEQLDDFAQPLGSFLGRDNAVHLLSEKDTWRPPVNIRETSSRYVLEVELPGFGPDDVNVEVEEGILKIQCARPAVDTENNVIRRERMLGRFQRDFKLPEKTLPEHISAHMQEGVLLINVPRATSPSTTQIDIT